MSTPSTPVVVGLDVGTTSAKATAYDATGTAVGSAAVEIRTIHPAPARAEQDPDAVVDAALASLRGAIGQAREGGATVAGLALGAAMHSLVGVDGGGAPVTPLLPYADGRATGQAARLAGDAGLALYRRTGTPVHPMSPLVKLRWFREEAPQTWAAARRWYSFKEYLLARLLGDAWPRVVDVSVASTTGLLALADAHWDDAAVAWCGVPRSALSDPAPTRTVLRGMPQETAVGLGLDRGVPVVLGAADGAAANLGVGAVGAVGAVTIGTSGAVRTVVDRPEVDDRGRTFCYVLTRDGDGDDRYVVGGATSNGGSVLRWLHDVVGPDGDNLSRLLARADAVPPGAEGLMVVPYLHGERAPRWRPGLSAAVVGLGAHHGRDQLVRAGLEGVALQLGLILEAVTAVAGAPRRLRATGGFTRSPVWTGIVADVLGVPLELSTTAQAGAFGAAILGLDALDLIESVTAGVNLAGVRRVVDPDPGRTGTYRELGAAYAAVVDHLVDDGFLAALRRAGTASAAPAPGRD